MPNQPITYPSNSPANDSWGIHVHSIGQSGASLVKAIKQITPLSEQKIAGMLYQAPTKLFAQLPKQAAKDIHQLLQQAGLNCDIVDDQVVIESGDDQHEVALVIKDVSRMTEIAQLIMNLIGADIHTVRQMLFTTPTVLLGKISKNTAETIRERFAPLAVEVDISRPNEAQFDVFLGSCSDLELHQIKKMFAELRTPLLPDHTLQANTLLTAGLDRTQADEVWNKISRTAFPIRIVNRDFERFDITLEQLTDSPAARDYLISSTGMPPAIAEKMLQRLPMVLHQNVAFQQLEHILADITALGGQATGNLLVFQTFSLQIEDCPQVPATVDILHALGNQDKVTLAKAIAEDGRIEGPFSSLQARWIQHELKKIGCSVNRILR